MFAAQPKHQPEYTAEELRSTKLLLEHCLSYLKHHHDQNDGGLHINLIARIKEALERPEHKHDPDYYLVVDEYGNTIGVYTSPPARHPLCVTEIREIGESFRENRSPDKFIGFARAIEKAHGIIQE